MPMGHQSLISVALATTCDLLNTILQLNLLLVALLLLRAATIKMASRVWFELPAGIEILRLLTVGLTMLQAEKA